MINVQLTTEQIRKLFKNNFDLCNFAITIGQNMIMAGPATLAAILEEVEERAHEAKEPNALS
jgi:hypothetical protein